MSNKTPLALVKRQLADIHPYEKNARKNDAAVDAVVESIRQCGYIAPIIVDEDGVILAGHTRYKALTKLGKTEVECIVREGLTEEQKKKYRLLDNKTNELADWDLEMLAEELADLDFGDLDLDWGIDLDETFEQKMAQHDQFEEDEEYEEFLDKFKGKKTTDDCYTPAIVYEAVADWVAAEYGVDRENMVRPFYPGGDYQNFKYSKDSVVVDNPPFSIMSEICRFYQEKEIPFFMFAPTLTLMGIRAAHKIACGVAVTYENGAVVNTSFVTNMDENEVRSAPDLYKAVKDANTANLAESKKELPKYEYPNEVLTATFVARLSKYGVEFKVKPESCHLISSLDAQKETGAGIFGSGFLISEKAAAEKAAAEKQADENAMAAQLEAEKVTKTCWKLSDSEMEIVMGLR